MAVAGWQSPPLFLETQPPTIPDPVPKIMQPPWRAEGRRMCDDYISHDCLPPRQPHLILSNVGIPYISFDLKS